MLLLLATNLRACMTTSEDGTPFEPPVDVVEPWSFSLLPLMEESPALLAYHGTSTPGTFRCLWPRLGDHLRWKPAINFQVEQQQQRLVLVHSVTRICIWLADVHVHHAVKEEHFS